MYNQVCYDIWLQLAELVWKRGAGSNLLLLKMRKTKHFQTFYFWLKKPQTYIQFFRSSFMKNNEKKIHQIKSCEPSSLGKVPHLEKSRTLFLDGGRGSQLLGKPTDQRNYANFVLQFKSPSKKEETSFPQFCQLILVKLSIPIQEDIFLRASC